MYLPLHLEVRDYVLFFLGVGVNTGDFHKLDTQDWLSWAVPGFKCDFVKDRKISMKK
jgi:hypothetical protein